MHTLVLHEQFELDATFIFGKTWEQHPVIDLFFCKIAQDLTKHGPEHFIRSRGIGGQHIIFIVEQVKDQSLLEVVLQITSNSIHLLRLMTIELPSLKAA